MKLLNFIITLWIVLIACQAQLLIPTIKDTFQKISFESIFQDKFGSYVKNLVNSISYTDPETGATQEEERYVVTNPDNGEEELVVMGKYSYVDDNDIETMTTYYADRDGYRTQTNTKNRKYSAKSLKTFAG